MSGDTLRSVRDRGSDMQLRETSGASLGTRVAEGQVRQTKALRESSTRGRRTKGCHFGHEWAATAHGQTARVTRGGGALAARPTPTGDSPMLRHQVAAETSPGARAQVAVGEGLRSGHGPVAEFLVGAAASSTARIHRVLSSFRALRKEPHPGRELLRARGSLSDAHRCIPDARFDNPSRRSPPALDLLGYFEDWP